MEIKMIDLYSEEDDRFYDVEFARVDNGGKYPGSFTKKEYDWLKTYALGSVLHLFSGSSVFGDVRVDLANPNATHQQDVFEFLRTNTRPFDSVVLDPPYNAKFAERYAALFNGKAAHQFIIFAQCQKTTDLWTLLHHLSPRRILLKSWNWYIVKGYHMFRCFVCYAGGYRKPTFFLIMDRNEAS
jgi:hypothetical protein